MMSRGEERTAGAITQFWLLMWKNFLQQWRHHLQTILEVLLPVSAMTLVLIMRAQIEPTFEGLKKYTPIPAYTLKYSVDVLKGMNISQLGIAYSPESPVLEDILKKATAKLISLNKRDYAHLDIIQKLVKISVYPYNNSESLRTVYTSEKVTKSIIAGVEFDDELYGAARLSHNLKYYLRFPERPRLYSFYSQGSMSWYTDATFPHFHMPGPRNKQAWQGGDDPGYVTEMFIALQHLISMELIENVTARDLSDFRVAINRYPHPPYIEDLSVETGHFLIPMLIMASFSYTAMNTVRAITLEKELQLKETMKIMGLPTWLHWTAWFCKQFIFLLVISVLIVLLVKVPWFKNEEGFSTYAVFTNTPWTVLLFFFLLYSSCTIFFCFMLSGFFSKASTAASFSGVIWFLTYLPATALMLDIKMSTSMQAALCLSINTAMAFGLHFIMAEENTQGLQWDQFWRVSDLDSNRFVFGTVVVMLVVDCVLYMLIALYLDHVLPGPHAAPKPWYFIFQKSFWSPRKTAADVPIDLLDSPDITMESVLGNPTVGVKISNLTKYYGKNLAVNNLCLDVYDDQITIILGHNGAGKSTTISMLAGNTEITSGSVWLAGYDISRQTQAARANLGFCSQYNVLFKELTVTEHLEFFGRLKGLTGQDLLEDIETLITKLGLTDKRDYMSAGLSGGQKRRLSVGIALSGGPRVVLLDEPLSGMDPISRRALCDLLQKEKMGRSLIVATHFMQEADLLGDRVAIMSSGHLQCIGSPFFLKRHYGIGYTLIVVKKEGFRPDACTKIIGRHIDGIMVKEDIGTELKYILTSDQSHLFEAMLRDLEANIDYINYENFGLTPTTLEDVFMSVGSDLAPNYSASNDEDTSTSSIQYAVSSVPAMSKKLLWMRHILAVWLKLWLVWSRSWRLLLTQVLVSLLMINVTLGILQWATSAQSNVVPRALTLSQGFVETETLLSFNGTSLSPPGAVAKTAYEEMFINNNIETTKITLVEDQTINDYYLHRTAEPLKLGIHRRRILIGATFDENSVTAWFSNFGYHDVAISLNAVHEALLKAADPKATLSVFNYPLKVNYADKVVLLIHLITFRTYIGVYFLYGKITTAKNDMQIYVDHISMQLASGIGSSLSLVSSIFVMFYIKERILRAKLLQEAAGIQPFIMWGSAAAFDWAWFLIICVTIVMSLMTFHVLGLSTASEVGIIYLALMVYGATMLPLNYLTSLLFPGPVMGFVTMFFINIVFGQMGSQIVELLLSPKLNAESVAETFDYVLQFVPLYDLVRSVTFMNNVGLTRWSCLRKCDYLAAVEHIGECSMETMCNNNFTSCCVRDHPFFEWDKPGILRYLTCSLVTCVVLWASLMFIEYKVNQKIFSWAVWAAIPPPLDESSMDADVVEEIRRVNQIGEADLSQYRLVAKSLSKYYGEHLAVNQVSFAMPDAEVFGLLGVNGAGKTTTFKMLMGDETISSGDAFIRGHSVKTDITSVHKNIGYCPQFDAVFSELTGRETLRLFSMVRGLSSQDGWKRAEMLVDMLGFTEHLDKRVDQYSGGTKRKLSIAIALLGSMRLVFVDEPTAGVDPAAKRRVWRAILDARRAGRGVVLTSHSMEECEALCSRLTIMVNGKFKCLGTPQHLKDKFFQGFILRIKMKMDANRTDSTENARGISAVKRYVESNFTSSKLMERHQGLLTYYLPDQRIPWSRMFGIMERCGEKYDVEDYIIAQTSLEDIFLQVTKYQRRKSTWT